jgi:hypothetical protein
MLSSIIMKNENRVAMHISMVVGRRGDNVWGRAYGPMMMIVESAPTLAEVKSKVKRVIERDGVSKVEGFDLEYDLSSLFDRFPFLVASGISKRARIREGRLKLYANGSKHASIGNVKALEAVIRKLGKQLAAIELQIPEHKKFTGKDVLSNYIPWFISVDDYMRSLGPHQMLSSNRKKREPPDPSEDQEWEWELPADVF